MARRSLALFLTLALTGALAGPAGAQIGTNYEWSADRPDGVAPAGVLGARTYEPGAIDFSYRFEIMRFGGNRIDTNPLPISRVHDLFFVAPVESEVSMSLFGVTYAPSEKLTLELSVPFLVRKTMDNVTADGQFYETDSGIWEDEDRYGFGDAKLLGHVPVYADGAYRAHLTGGVLFPLGSIRQTDVTPLTNRTRRTRVTYPLQLGSGSWGLLPGFTVYAMNEQASAGIQGSGTLYLHKNDLSYRPGHRFTFNVWGAYRFNDYVSASIRTSTKAWGNVSGADPTLSRNLNPAANPQLQGGTRVELPAGLNFHFPDGILEGHRLGFEAALPIYQNLDGPQLEHDWTLHLSWAYLLER